MSELVPSMLALDKGLDLQTTKIIAPPGSVLDSLNYEQVDFQGQKRIDGYARYDGSGTSAIDEYYVMQLSDLTTTMSPGYILTVNGTPFGVVGEVDGDDVYYSKINTALVINVDDVVRLLDPSSGMYLGTGSVVSDATGTSTATSPEAHYVRLLSVSSAIRSFAEDLPGAVIGLHWFRDRLYAVADALVVAVSGDSPAMYPNDTVTIGGLNYPVLDAYTVPDQRILWLGGTTQPTLGEDVVRKGTVMGVVQEPMYLPASATDIATIYESRTEQQVMEEDLSGMMDFGWRARHLGWSVNFVDGLALYGGLAAVNQNRQGVGVQGPTDTSGTSGSPAVLSQNIAVTNRPAQVNGWKSYDSTTAYVLDPADVQQQDSAYVYADAFISWAADSVVVSTPGSDMVNLTEYAPTSTIRYTT